MPFREHFRLLEDGIGSEMIYTIEIRITNDTCITLFVDLSKVPTAEIIIVRFEQIYPLV